MAIRQIDTKIWNDPTVADNMTPEDRYFWFYLLTNPLGNLSGCFQVSYKQMANTLGYSEETVINLVYRFKNLHKLIDYNEENMELFIFNWWRYNWTTSPKFETALLKFTERIKTQIFRENILNFYKLFKKGDTVSIRYRYGSISIPITNTISNTNTKETNTSNNSNTNGKIKTKKKQSYGDFKNVNLTDEEFEKLKEKPNYEKFIQDLSLYKESSGKKYKSDYATILNWMRKDKGAGPNERPESEEIKYIPRHQR